MIDFFVHMLSFWVHVLLSLACLAAVVIRIAISSPTDFVTPEARLAFIKWAMGSLAFPSLAGYIDYSVPMTWQWEVTLFFVFWFAFGYVFAKIWWRRAEEHSGSIDYTAAGLSK